MLSVFLIRLKGLGYDRILTDINFQIAEMALDGTTG